MLTGPYTWYKARITYLGEVPIEVLPVQTNDPETYEQGLRSNYSTADSVEVWEVDRYGEPTKKNTAKKQEDSGDREEAGAPASNLLGEGETTQGSKRIPGLGQLFK